MTDLKQILIEVAEAAPELCWPSDIKLACPHATPVAVNSAVQAMALWRDATDPVSVAFAGHALDRAVRYLQVKLVVA